MTTVSARALTRIGENLNNSNEFEYSRIFYSIQIDFLIFFEIHIQFKSGEKLNIFNLKFKYSNMWIFIRIFNLKCKFHNCNIAICHYKSRNYFEKTLKFKLKLKPLFFHNYLVDCIRIYWIFIRIFRIFQVKKLNIIYSNNSNNYSIQFTLAK